MRIENKFNVNPFVSSSGDDIYSTRGGESLQELANILDVNISELIQANPFLAGFTGRLPRDVVIRIAPKNGKNHSSPKFDNPTPAVFYETANKNILAQWLDKPTLRKSSIPGESGGGSAEGWSDAETILDEDTDFWSKAFNQLVEQLDEPTQEDLYEVAEQLGVEIERITKAGPVIKKVVKAIEALIQYGISQKKEKGPQDLAKYTEKLRIGMIRDFYTAYQIYEKENPETEGLNALKAFLQAGIKRLPEIYKHQQEMLKRGVGVPSRLNLGYQVIHGAVTLFETVTGKKVPDPVKDILKIAEYFISAVPAFVGDLAKAIPDAVEALYRTAVEGDRSAYDRWMQKVINQEYGPVFQGYAMLVDLFFTGGQYIDQMDLSRIPFLGPIQTFLGKWLNLEQAPPSQREFLFERLNKPAYELYFVYRMGVFQPEDLSQEILSLPPDEKERFIHLLTESLPKQLEGMGQDLLHGRIRVQEYYFREQVTWAMLASLEGHMQRALTENSDDTLRVGLQKVKEAREHIENLYKEIYKALPDDQAEALDRFASQEYFKRQRIWEIRARYARPLEVT